MKYQHLIQQMTLEEKASLMSGDNFWNTKSIERLNIPSMMLTDGPHGLRKQGGKADRLGLNKSLPATCFPTAATLANSWDINLLTEVGECLGKEAAAEDVSVLLGPGLEIKRNPLGGRNFEYFSEDPFLSGKLSAAMIKGIQSQGVSACPKHFAVNSQEGRRMVINEVVDERALREIYLEGFRMAVQEGKAKTIMTAYNQVNGIYANEHTRLLQDILCQEWKFDGLIVTDWGGNNDRVAGLIAGNQLEMPSASGITDAEIVTAVKNGTIDESLLDQRVNSYLNILFETKKAMGKGRLFTHADHHKKAEEAARESIVLLKNKENALPLVTDEKVAIIGDFAKIPRYQGAGSSLVQPVQLDNTLDTLEKSDLTIIGYEKGFKRFGGYNSRLSKRAINLASQADTILFFAGLDESLEAECIDRPHMSLPENQNQLINKLSQIGKKLIVVLCGGAAVEMPWIENIHSLLHVYLPGQAGGKAVADVLTGKHNPSGKLAESYAYRHEDYASTPWFPGKQLTAEHKESIFIGYRYFDSVNKDVLFPFGYGLSYTSFEYQNVSYEKNKVRFSIQNTGKVAGSEIAQVYVAKKGSKIIRAKKELKGFAKVYLEPNEKTEVEIALDERAFQYYNTKVEKWVTEPGKYEVLVGSSSRDIQLIIETQLMGDDVELPNDLSMLPNYASAQVHKVTDAEFEKLLGETPPPTNWDIAKPLGINDTIGQGKYKKGFAKFLYTILMLIRKISLALNKPIWANNVMFLIDLPYRQISRMSNGMITPAMQDGIMVMINGHFWKGLKMTLFPKK